MTRNLKIAIPVALLAAALAAYWFLALAPKREEAVRLGDQIADKQAEVSQSQATLARVQRAQKEYPSNVTELARLGKAVPGDDDICSLMVQLDTAASRSGVDFRTVEVGAGAGSSDPPSASQAAKLPPGAVPVGSAGFSAVPFKFAFEGNFFNISTFFSRLERFVTVANSRIRVTGRLLRLESISLKPASAGFPQIKAEINASSYLVPPTPSVTGATPQGADPSSAGAAPAGGSSTPPTTAATATGAVQ